MTRRDRTAEKLGVAMIGGKTSTIGFRALGVDTYTVVFPENAEEVWEEIPLDRYAVIFVTEPIYEKLAERIEDFVQEKRDLPVITVMPSVAVSEEVGIKDIRQRVEKAVGVDMFEA